MISFCIPRYSVSTIQKLSYIGEGKLDLVYVFIVVLRRRPLWQLGEEVLGNVAVVSNQLLVISVKEDTELQYSLMLRTKTVCRN